MRSKTVVIFTALFSMLLSLLVVTASPAQAHVSRCNIEFVGLPLVDRARGMVGGVAGEFKCDPFDNHHAYIGMKGEVQVMTMNLPGSRWDRFQTLSSGISRANTTKSRASLSTVGWCMKGNRTYRMKFTIVMVGTSGTVTKSETGFRKTGNC